MEVLSGTKEAKEVRFNLHTDTFLRDRLRAWERIMDRAESEKRVINRILGKRQEERTLEAERTLAQEGRVSQRKVVAQEELEMEARKKKQKMVS